MDRRAQVQQTTCVYLVLFSGTRDDLESIPKGLHIPTQKNVVKEKEGDRELT